MRRVIALEDTLSGMKRALENEGYDVKSMNEGVRNADAVIVSGLEENVTGVEDRLTEAFVINARGRQPEEILYDLKKHFNLMD